MYSLHEARSKCLRICYPLKLDIGQQPASYTHMHGISNGICMYIIRIKTMQFSVYITGVS
jgi:hypothetical protein